MGKEKNNALMEKLFFKHIMNNPEQFNKIQPHFFKNEDIRFVYNIIREEYLLSKVKVIPSNKQIFAMVKLHEQEREVSAETLKLILKDDESDYGEEWLVPRYKAWRSSNNLQDNLLKSMEYVKSVDESDYENVKSVITKIKNISNELDIIDNDDDDLGYDFDNPEAHRQDETVQKIQTGWPSLDTVLSGGWDFSSLSVLIGSTNVGKCAIPTTTGVLRNKKTGEIINISLGDFFEMVKNNK
jgi:hypothetical protein